MYFLFHSQFILTKNYHIQFQQFHIFFFFCHLVGDGLEELSVQKGITAEEIQKQLLVIWKRLLEKDEITINDSFKTFSGNETSTKRKGLIEFFF